MSTLYRESPIETEPLVPADAPMLPRARGPISGALLDLISDDWPVDLRVLPDLDGASELVDPLLDDDFQLALHAIYELSYRGFAGVDDRWEWDPAVLELRAQLESRFEAALRHVVAATQLTDHADDVGQVLDRFHGPSLSLHMEERGTIEQFREFAIHRSAYQLKEADPHSWGIPRFSGPRKAALVEIQSDEYGNGLPGEAHADLFADLMTSLDLDAAYGTYIDRLPGVTLATGNLITMLGTQRRLRAALLGHLAGFELTSVTPMTRYLLAAMRLRLDEPVRRFYEVHVEADEHHGALAAGVLVGGDPAADGLDPAEICFGAAAMLVVEDRFARHLLHAWAHDRSSLLPA
ncbi:MAG: iron-containing redox enzyme family protein [Acidimicrobiales bacterium]